jgi:hypothetical protein
MMRARNRKVASSRTIPRGKLSQGILKFPGSPVEFPRTPSLFPPATNWSLARSLKEVCGTDWRASSKDHSRGESDRFLIISSPRKVARTDQFRKIESEGVDSELNIDRVGLAYLNC